MTLRTRFAVLGLSTAAVLGTVLGTSAQADPDWPFPQDCEKRNYSQYMTWAGRTGWIDFTYDHTDDRINNYYRSTWRATGERVGSGPGKGWASCINLHQ
ncbi:hypothetical protein ACWGBH_33805 [Streptomyces massasporeus]